MFELVCVTREPVMFLGLMQFIAWNSTRLGHRTSKGMQRSTDELSSLNEVICSQGNWTSLGCSKPRSSSFRRWVKSFNEILASLVHRKKLLRTLILDSRPRTIRTSKIEKCPPSATDRHRLGWACGPWAHIYEVFEMISWANEEKCDVQR